MNVDQRTGTASAEPRSIETLGRPDPMALPPPPESIVNMYELTFGTVCGVCAGVFVKKGIKALAWLFGGAFVFLQVSAAYLDVVEWKTFLFEMHSCGFTNSTLAPRRSSKLIGPRPLPVSRDCFIRWTRKGPDVRQTSTRYGDGWSTF